MLLNSLLLAIFLSLASSVVSAAEPIVYPAKKQSQDQMEYDKFQCYGWARNQSGFDPMATQASQVAQAEQRQGGLLRGAAAGAAVGGIADGSDGAEKGAAIGAVLGRLRQSSRNQTSAKKEQQQRSQESADRQALRGQYERAYSACLEGRGYTVK